VVEPAVIVGERKGRHQERMKLGQGFLVFWVEVEIIAVVTVVAIITMDTTMVKTMVTTMDKIMVTTMDKIMVSTMAIIMVKTMGITTAKTVATTTAKTVATTTAKTMATTMDKTMATIMAKTLETITSNQVVSVGMTCFFRTNTATLMGHAEGLMRLVKPGAILLDGTVVAGTCPGQENIQTTLGLIRHAVVLGNRTKYYWSRRFYNDYIMIIS